MNVDLAALRREYARQALNEDSAEADPIAQFRRWFDEALAAEVLDPNAMTLATASPAGHPSARIVLLKGFDADGFALYTNYESRKAQELEANPWAALVFWWGVLERQVRVEGQVERVAERDSDAYFGSRPRGSRLGAWASPQSRVIAGRDVLESRLEEAEARFPDESVPRPSYWGGYRVRPEAVEFWQGRPSRLHDRLRYRRAEEGVWLVERLAP